MKKIEFIDNKTKNQYNLFIGITPSLKNTIDIVTKDNPIKVIYTIKHHHGAEVGIVINNETISFYIDYFERKVYVKDYKKPYLLVYDFFANSVSIHGYLYKKENRSIIDKSQMGSKNKYMYYFELKDNDKKYTIDIISLDSNIDREYIVNKLLDYENKFNTINDLFILLSTLITIDECNIEIKDNLKSKIIVKNGQIEKFVQYQNNEFGTKDKLYLEDGKFYIEKKVKEEYDDEDISYVKKLGVNNGKEKRKD